MEESRSRSILLHADCNGKAVIVKTNFSHATLFNGREQSIVSWEMGSLKDERQCLIEESTGVGPHPPSLFIPKDHSRVHTTTASRSRFGYREALQA